MPDRCVPRRGELARRVTLRTIGRLVGIRDRDDPPSRRRLEKLHRVDTAVTRGLAEMEVVFGPYCGERAAHADFRRPRPLDPWATLIRRHEGGEPVPWQHLH